MPLAPYSLCRNEHILGGKPIYESIHSHPDEMMLTSAAAARSRSSSHVNIKDHVSGVMFFQLMAENKKMGCTPLLFELLLNKIGLLITAEYICILQLHRSTGWVKAVEKDGRYCMSGVVIVKVFGASWNFMSIKKLCIPCWMGRNTV